MEQRQSSQVDYANFAQEVMAYPRDAFELTAFSFDTNDPREIAEAMGKFSNLINKDILLANLAEQMIPYYQEDTRILTHMFSLACRDEGIRPYFKVIYNGWKNELMITRTKDGKGMEFLIKVASMKDSRHQAGYGEYLPTEEETKEGVVAKIKKMFGM